MRRHSIIALAAFAALTVAAIPTRAQMMSPWNGFYVGASVGGGVGDNKIHQNYLPSPAFFALQPLTTSTSVDGGLVGLGGLGARRSSSCSRCRRNRRSSIR